MYSDCRNYGAAHGFSVRLHRESDTNSADEAAIWSVRMRRRSNNQIIGERSGRRAFYLLTKLRRVRFVLELVKSAQYAHVLFGWAYVP